MARLAQAEQPLGRVPLRWCDTLEEVVRSFIVFKEQGMISLWYHLGNEPLDP